MPYKLEKRKTKWCVLKESGEVKSCKFDSRKKALDYLAMLEMIHKWKAGKGPKPKGVK